LNWRLEHYKFRAETHYIGIAAMSISVLVTKRVVKGPFLYQIGKIYHQQRSKKTQCSYRNREYTCHDFFIIYDMISQFAIWGNTLMECMYHLSPVILLEARFILYILDNNEIIKRLQSLLKIIKRDVGNFSILFCNAI